MKAMLARAVAETRPTLTKATSNVLRMDTKVGYRTRSRAAETGAEGYVTAWRRAVAAASLTLIASASWAEDGALSDINYRLGNGLRAPGLGLAIGGYVTGTYEKLQSLPGRAALHDLSLSIWWEGAGRWKVFSEFDYENTLSSRSSRTDDEDRYLALERVYVDYAVDEVTTLRAGKFLTPVGRWNLIHASPLVWTTSRPLVTTVAFPTNVTGLMVSGSASVAGNALDYSVFGSSGNEVRPSPTVDTFREALGLRLVAPLPIGGQVGMSYVSFEQTRSKDVRKQLYGVDFFWTRSRVEVSAEAVYRVLRDPASRNEAGGFVQVVVPLADRLSAVGRYEIYRQAQQTAPIRLWVAGASYRLNPAVVLKAEWVGGRRNDIGAPTGFLSSVSVLF